MKYIKKFNESTFSDFYPKNKWVKLSLKDRRNFKHDLYDIINLAYTDIGGHVRITAPNDIINDKNLTFWTAVDIDKDPNADVVIFSRKSNGYKISGWGHDGSKEAKKELLKKLINILQKKGFWIEVSGRPAEILINAGCKINDYNTVRRIFPNSKINWLGNGAYTRTLPDGKVTEEEYLVGSPL
jgi:hypothetical protein